MPGEESREEPVAFPPKFREVSFTGKSSSIILRSTYEDETLKFLLEAAIGYVLTYEVDSLKEKIIANMKEVKKI